MLQLTLGHLYADLMNVYADRGNIICLRQRCSWRGIELTVRPFGIGDELPWEDLDLVFMGGGQDGEQRLLTEDLMTLKGPSLIMAAASGLPMLVVCGAYQLFGHSYQPASGVALPGLGILDTETIHPGEGKPRCIGNVVVSDLSGLAGEQTISTLVGFENHGGRTYLASTARPLGSVLVGKGNNGQDGTEGAISNNVFGTYLHGPLLPKNPHFADHLLGLALSRRYGAESSKKALTPLKDQSELEAHIIVRKQFGAKNVWERLQHRGKGYREAWSRFRRGG